ASVRPVQDTHELQPVGKERPLLFHCRASRAHSNLIPGVNRRRLGGGGLVVSAIGLGQGSTTTNFGTQDDAEQIATMRRALDLGVDFLDTSDAYARGHHEELIGQAIRGRRPEGILATKFGTLDLAGGKGYNGRPDYVPRACEASLRRLGVDVIDLYYLHRLDPDVPIEDTVGAMTLLAQAGKVRHLGLSEVGPATLRRAC